MSTLMDAAASLNARITDRRDTSRADERLETELANIADALALLCRLQAEAFDVPGAFVAPPERDGRRYGQS
jgi:hypothetical protein